jgi:hypothetical protein
LSTELDSEEQTIGGEIRLRPNEGLVVQAAR